MDDLKFVSHPNEIFHDWYQQSQGKGDDKGFVEKYKAKSQFLLKSIFTQIVPSMDRMEYNAMVLATANSQGVPSSRVVLLKGYSEKAYVFYTNYDSSKSKDLIENPVASLNFFWAYPTRQVRISGRVEKTSYEESQAYWQSRPRGSQEGALASQQSDPINNYEQLLSQLSEVKKKYAHREIPCPEHWGGFRVVPNSYEFWQAMPNRLHRRVKFDLVDGRWNKSYLSP